MAALSGAAVAHHFAADIALVVLVIVGASVRDNLTTFIADVVAIGVNVRGALFYFTSVGVGVFRLVTAGPHEGAGGIVHMGGLPANRPARIAAVGMAMRLFAASPSECRIAVQGVGMVLPAALIPAFLIPSAAFAMDVALLPTDPIKEVASTIKPVVFVFRFPANRIDGIAVWAMHMAGAFVFLVTALVVMLVFRQPAAVPLPRLRLRRQSGHGQQGQAHGQGHENSQQFAEFLHKPTSFLCFFRTQRVRRPG